MPTLWDNRFEKDTVALERWLYGAQSLTGATRKWFIDQAKTWSKGTTLLDAGCGGGVTAYHLLENNLLDNIKYTGMDGSVCMLQLAKRKVVHSNVRWVLSPLDNIDKTYTFDRILLRAVIEHNLDPTNILRSIAAMLKPNGILYIIFWNNPVFIGEAEIKKTKDGFYDNSHSMDTVLSVLQEENITLIHKEFIKEKSENSNKRFVTKFKKL